LFLRQAELVADPAYIDLARNVDAVLRNVCFALRESEGLAQASLQPFCDFAAHAFILFVNASPISFTVRFSCAISCVVKFALSFFAYASKANSGMSSLWK